MLERGDIHEELDRLAIHVQKLDELIEAQCPVGRGIRFPDPRNESGNQHDRFQIKCNRN